MCIVLISTAHPSYSLILINNRDEFLARPTALASFWPPPYGHVLGGRDLLRPAQGTWLGVTRDGRVAVLTNFREEQAQAAQGQVSRGEMVNAFLKPPATDIPDVDAFVRDLVSGDGARGAGGFSLVCGNAGEKLAVVSNRTSGIEAVKWIDSAGETVGLSNAAFGDRTWPKVVDGEKVLKEIVDGAIAKDVGEQELIEQLFSLLSIDTLPPQAEGEGWDSHIKQLRNSIFIPVIGESAKKQQGQSGNATTTNDAQNQAVVSEEEAMSGAYGTQRQSVLLVDRQGKATFVEKSLFSKPGNHDKSAVKTSTFEFTIEK